jgi:hypothetical protein
MVATTSVGYAESRQAKGLVATKEQLLPRTQ